MDVLGAHGLTGAVCFWKMINMIIRFAHCCLESIQVMNTDA